MKFYLPALILIPLLLTSCGKKEVDNTGVLLRYGDKILTYSDVESQIPNGLLPVDSVSLFTSIVEGWIRDEVLADFAEKRLYDLQAINRKVTEYRNALIVEEYLSRMRESQAPKIDDAALKEYYDQYKGELKLETPLIKGIFLKINKDAKGREQIKSLLTPDDAQKIDMLEDEWLDKALEYNYFRDKWVDWETIQSMIPYRFGDAAKFVESTDFFETDYDDCAYYLFIAERMMPGEIQPFEYAKTWIADVLTRGRLADYERNLVNSLISKSLDDKTLQAVGYDPIKHEIKK